MKATTSNEDIMNDKKAIPSSSSSSNDDNLDSFLTTIESKLRLPFSSLDLAKAVSTTKLRTSLRRSSQLGRITGSSSTEHDAHDPAKEYLENLSRVLIRTDKVKQCRMLIGLLGLSDVKRNDDNNIENTDTNDNNDRSDNHNDTYLSPEIINILHQTQEESLYEDWVRTTSGLIEGIMFRTNNDNTRESCRSKEATKIIVDTGTGVCKKAESQIQRCSQPYVDDMNRRKQHQHNRLAAIDGDSREKASDTKSTTNRRIRGFMIEKVTSSSSSSSSSQPSQLSINETKEEHQEVGSDALLPSTPDLNASFAPYRYSLISTPVLNTIIPEFDTNSNNNENRNCHFHVNSNADILQIDLRLEAQRAKEHMGGSATTGSHKAANNKNQNGVTINNTNDPNSNNNAGKSFLPGYRPVNQVPSVGIGTVSGNKRKAGTSGGSAGSSLFMPKKKKPTNLFNTTTKFRPQPVKTVLRRKIGGAQALLKSANGGSGGAGLTTLGGSNAGSRGGSSSLAAGRFGGSNRVAGRGIKPKMKIIDVDDSADLLSKNRSTSSSSKMSASRASKRERILMKGRTGGGAPPSVVATKKTEMMSPSLSPQHSPAKQQRSDAVATTVTSPQLQQQQRDIDLWHSLLRDRSNKMSDDDKVRGEKFFTTDPTERCHLQEFAVTAESVHKMKIHEARGTDPSTGQTIKETFYLSLDYTTGEQKQSRKLKRY